MAEGYAARLKGKEDHQGGIPLADGFREIMTAIWDAGGKGCRLPALVKAIQIPLAYLDTRVRHVWGDWETLAGDLLDALADANLISSYDGVWTLTAKAQPEARLSIQLGKGNAARAQFVFYDARTRDARNVMGRAQVMAGELSAYLRDSGVTHPVITQARIRAEAVAALLSRSINQPVRASAVMKGGAGWLRQFVRAQPQDRWFSVDDACQEWDRQYPDRPLPCDTKSGRGAAFRQEARRLSLIGVLDVRAVKMVKHGGRLAQEYRWTGEDPERR
jgi:hypothetical protein